MLRLTAHRLAISLPLVLAVSLLIFGLESLVPGDPARTILGESATQESIDALRAEMGLDRPWFERYGQWLAGLVRGDLGTSIFTGEPVTAVLNDRLGVSLSLVTLCMIVSGAVGVLLGMVSAVRGRLVGRLLDVVSLAGLALPSFWVAIILVAVFAVRLRLLPATGYVPATESVTGWLTSLVLPVVALCLLGVTAVAKQTRDSAMEVLDADYVQVLRANGVPEWKILLKHVLRNAAIPVVSVLGVVTVGMLDATVFVESVFVLPGLGSRATQATIDHDISVILGIGVYFTVLVILINLVVDIVYGVLNPKVRSS